MDSQQQASEFMRGAIHQLPAVERSTIDEHLHRLHWNENPFDFPADLKEEVLQRIAQTSWANYPSALRPFHLIDRLAAHLGVSSERIVVSCGSSDLIRALLASVLEPGDALVMPTPTFVLYRRNGRVAGAAIHEVSTNPETDFCLPVDDLIVSARTNQAKLVVLCAPNNPTGTIYALADLRRIADESGALVAIDEAYAEFSGQDLLPLLNEFDNVVLLRTFSKAFSMAGVRVGYALAAPAIATDLQKAINSFPLGVFAEVVAEVALDHHDRFMASVRQIVAERERLATSLRKLPGVQVFSSGANFLLVRPKAPAATIFHHLLTEQHVLVSDMGGYPELHDYLRISIGAPAQNDLVLRAFADYS